MHRYKTSSKTSCFLQKSTRQKNWQIFLKRLSLFLTLSAIYGQVCTWGHERGEIQLFHFLFCIVFFFFFGLHGLLVCPMSISTLCRVLEFEKKTKGIRLDISKQFRSLIFGFHFCIVRIVGKKFLNQHKTNHLINFEYLV